MKKSIKYAGIAAATLLAVAPVAAPVVSTTTVNASSQDDQGKQDDAVVNASIPDDQGKQDDAVAAFGAQFKDQAADLVKAGGVKLGTFKVGSSDTASEFDAANSSLLTGTKLTDAKQFVLLNSKGDASVTVSAKYGNASVKDNDDLAKVLADKTYPEVVFTITLNFNNMNGVATSKTFTEKATRGTAATSEMTTANATFTTPINVPLNSTTTSTVLKASNDAAIKDQNGNSVLTPADNVSVGTGFYDTYSAAINSIGKNAADQAASTTKNVGKNPDNGEESFLKAGTYYQTISFVSGSDKTPSALSSFLQSYDKNPAKYTVLVNGKQASAGYDFVPSASANGNEITITFVRSIVVANSTENWTTTSVDGTVTTKDGSAYYTLKNNDNNTIKNRALAKNTSWKTDKKRVDQDGNVQYRVATGEWIDADNVSFKEAGSTSTDNGSGLTDIQSVKGTVSVGQAGYTYLLYSKDGKLIKNRALAGGSDWAFINTAKDSDGTTYYRVATDEWVAAGNGVTVK